jgi:raffinose/stachyose/melibiose transport system substrate-binding protein
MKNQGEYVMKNRGYTSFFLVLAFLVLVMVVNAQEETTVVDFWSINFSGGAGTDPLEEIITLFEEVNPDVRINLEVRSTDAHKEAMRLALNTDTAPDAYWMWGGLGLGGFYVDGAQILDDEYENFGWKERFVPAAMESAYYDGDLYGVPLSIHVLALFYRKDIFEAAGIEQVPTTYDELMAANDQLVAAGYIPLSMGGKYGWMTMRLIDQLMEYACGAEMHDALKSLQANWAEESCVVDAYTELARWTGNYMPEAYLGVEPTEGIIPVYRGEAAMQYEGGWIIPRLISDEQDLENWGFFPFPTDTDRIYFFSEQLFIARNSDSREASARFIDFWTSPDVQQQYGAVFGGASPTVGVKPEQDNPLSSSFYDLITSAPGIFWPADMALPLSVAQAYFKANDDIVAGVIEPSEAGAIVQEAIDLYLAQN